MKNATFKNVILCPRVFKYRNWIIHMHLKNVYMYTCLIIATTSRMTKNDPFSFDAKKGKILKLLNKFVASPSHQQQPLFPQRGLVIVKGNSWCRDKCTVSCNLEVIKPEKIIIEIFASSSWRIHISCHNPGRTDTPNISSFIFIEHFLVEFSFSFTIANLAKPCRYTETIHSSLAF